MPIDLPLWLGLTLALAGPAPAGVCRCPCAQLGASAVFLPSPAAFALNRAGRDLYRQRRWDDARRSYQAALAEDPGFLAPRLNMACSYAQQERFAEAVAEASALAAQGFVPWAREIEEATDLAPLRVRREYSDLRAAIAQAAPAWGAPLADALLFVGRTAPAVNLPEAGILVLALAQEIFAYLPETGAYRQVTAEDGRVLAFARSRDGKTVIYVRAGKLVRSPGEPGRLRALSLRRLDLPSMTLGPPVLLPDDIQRLELSVDEAANGRLTTTGSDASAPRHWLFDGKALLPGPTPRRPPASKPVRLGPGAVVLDGNGVAPSRLQVSRPRCAHTASDQPAGQGAPGVWISQPAGARFLLAVPHGSGLFGLPFPRRDPRPRE